MEAHDIFDACKNAISLLENIDTEKLSQILDAIEVKDGEVIINLKIRLGVKTVKE